MYKAFSDIDCVYISHYNDDADVEIRTDTSTLHQQGNPAFECPWLMRNITPKVDIYLGEYRDIRVSSWTDATLRGYYNALKKLRDMSSEEQQKSPVCIFINPIHGNESFYYIRSVIIEYYPNLWTGEMISRLHIKISPYHK
jgi:hypothetical protein